MKYLGKENSLEKRNGPDTDRALVLLEEYCKKLRKPEEQQLKKAIRKGHLQLADMSSTMGSAGEMMSPIPGCCSEVMLVVLTLSASELLQPPSACAASWRSQGVSGLGLGSLKRQPSQVHADSGFLERLQLLEEWQNMDGVYKMQSYSISFQDGPKCKHSLNSLGTYESDIQEFYEVTLLNSQKSYEQKIEEANQVAEKWEKTTSATDHESLQKKQEPAASNGSEGSGQHGEHNKEKLTFENYVVDMKTKLCRMGTPICNMEKVWKIYPGHSWAAERGGGWPLQRAWSAVEPWKQMPAVIPILLVEKPIWEENKSRAMADAHLTNAQSKHLPGYPFSTLPMSSYETPSQTARLADLDASWAYEVLDPHKQFTMNGADSDPLSHLDRSMPSPPGFSGTDSSLALGISIRSSVEMEHLTFKEASAGLQYEESHLYSEQEKGFQFAAPATEFIEFAFQDTDNVFTTTNMDVFTMATSFTSKQKTAHATVSTYSAPIGISYSYGDIFSLISSGADTNKYVVLPNKVLSRYKWENSKLKWFTPTPPEQIFHPAKNLAPDKSAALQTEQKQESSSPQLKDPNSDIFHYPRKAKRKKIPQVEAFSWDLFLKWNGLIHSISGPQNSKRIEFQFLKMLPEIWDYYFSMAMSDTEKQLSLTNFGSKMLIMLAIIDLNTYKVQKYRYQDEDAPHDHTLPRLTHEVRGPELVHVSEKNLSQIENVHGYVLQSHISPLKVALAFGAKDVVLQLSWVADSLQKVRIDGMTFQWREEKNHLHMEQMGSAVYKQDDSATDFYARSLSQTKGDLSQLGDTGNAAGVGASFSSIYKADVLCGQRRNNEDERKEESSILYVTHDPEDNGLKKRKNTAIEEMRLDESNVHNFCRLRQNGCNTILYDIAEMDLFMWVYGHFQPSCFSLDLDKRAVTGIGLSESVCHICLALAMAGHVAMPWTEIFITTMFASIWYAKKLGRRFVHNARKAKAEKLMGKQQNKVLHISTTPTTHAPSFPSLFSSEIVQTQISISLLKLQNLMSFLKDVKCLENFRKEYYFVKLPTLTEKNLHNIAILLMLAVLRPLLLVEILGLGVLANTGIKNLAGSRVLEGLVYWNNEHRSVYGTQGLSLSLNAQHIDLYPLALSAVFVHISTYRRSCCGLAFRADNILPGLVICIF
ncbi:hypothetical protein IHE44_0005600 [Lamprotornis superbus]|uniref:Disks large homologue 1 N-terminal PEST domain-containing protein n=2 Tax=Sauria TaxID=32561 RepID=A0A835P108_9PASS|nr:hypothetical protein IHE44_0005600 [Lamprotornis superbus]